MNFILKKKFKFYTKEILKLFNIILIAFGCIIAIVLIKYKPIYEVVISGEKAGYIESKELFQQELADYTQNYKSKNIESIEIIDTPKYELKLVDKSQETNEDEVLIALQKDMKITYKYYDILINNERVESVNTLEEAEQLISEIKSEEASIEEKKTENIEEMQTHELEIAKSNILETLGKIEDSKAIANINGIRVATLPVTGTITSRYGVNSRIRSSSHTGLDIATSTGTPIKAISDGTVTFAEYKGAYGNLVKIDHGNGIESWYAHTSKMYVKVGQQVKAGDVIAAVGSTGNSTGSHLHLEIRINGQHVNPQNYLYK